MPRYFNINQALLGDEAFEDLSHEAQRAWFLLRLSYRLGVSGMGRVSARNLRADLDLDDVTLRAVLEELTLKRPNDPEKPSGWVRYDWEAGVLWFVGAFGLEPNTTQIRASAMRDVERLPSSSLLGAWGRLYAMRWSGATVRKDEVERFRAFFDRQATVNRPSGDGRPTVPRVPAPVPDPAPVPEPGNTACHEVAPTTRARGEGGGHAFSPRTGNGGTDPIDRSVQAIGWAQRWKLEQADAEPALQNALAGLKPVGRFRDTGRAVFQTATSEDRARVKRALEVVKGEGWASTVVIEVERPGPRRAESIR